MSTNGTKDGVTVDQHGQVVAENGDEFLTWEELSTPQIREMVVPGYGGKKIQYRSFVPLDELSEMQRRYLAKNPKDFFGYFQAILKAVMMRPAYSEQFARALGKMDGGVASQICTDVIGADEARKLEAGLKNQ